MGAYAIEPRQAWPVGWQVSVVSATCSGAAHRCADAATPKRIWGALQTALHALASPEAQAGGRCSWHPISAFDLLHNDWGRHGDGRGIPKPFSLSARPSGPDMVISVLLFGAACAARAEVGAALVAGLRRGIDGRAGGAPQNITARRIASPTGVAPMPEKTGPEQTGPEQTGPVVLQFLTPASVREGDRDHWAPFGVIKGIIGRVTGMARWHGVSLQAAAPALLDEAASLATMAEWSAPVVSVPGRGRYEIISL